MRHSAGAWSGKTSEVPVFSIGPQKETVSRFGAGTAEKLDRYLVLIGVCVNR